MISYISILTYEIVGLKMTMLPIWLQKLSGNHVIIKLIIDETTGDIDSYAAMCDLTIMLPCLNEAETLPVCIKKAKSFLIDNNVNGQILVVDNGSTDESGRIAAECGADVISVSEQGYGAALIAGNAAAKGKYVIMADADDSYDLYGLLPFLDKLEEGYDLVVGNRYKGGIEKGAMPFLHKYIGNPVLSFMGRTIYKSRVRDFNCGLRGYRKDSISALHLEAAGMEYASEMIIKSELAGLRITEVPTTLKKDGRSGRSHLRSFPDGWRHLKIIMKYAPESICRSL